MSLAHFPPNVMESPSADERTPLVFGRRSKRGRKSPSVMNDTGDPQIPAQLTGKTAILPLVCIILAVIFERIAYYGILANLVVFLTTDMEYAFGTDTVVLCVFMFTGMAWLMSTVGGFVGDSYSGRYNAIWGSLLIYFYGSFSLMIVTYYVAEKPKLQTHPNLSAFLTVSTLVLLSIGEGAYKANIAAFGAEQVLPTDQNTYRHFFNWYYWSINIGSFVAYSGLAWVQIRMDFFIGYLIPFCCVFLACLIFCIPRSSYIVKPASGNILSKIFGVMREAFKRRKERKNTNSVYPSLEEFLPIQSWMDRAMIKYGGTYLDSDVEEVKTLRNISLIFVAQIPYWIIYFQMNSTFLNQGLHMNVTLVEPLGFNIPAAWLSLTDVIFVIFLIPIMDKLVYPWLDKKGLSMTVLMRIAIGFLFAVASMVVAGVVESQRSHQIGIHNGTQVINNKNFTTAKMTILYQVPQYALIGISEVFASVGGLEFAYKEAPPTMQSFVMGMFYFVQSIGSLLGAGLYAFSTHVLHWTSDSGEHGPGENMDRYFYLLGGIMFISWLIFVVVSFRSKMGLFSGRNKAESINSSLTGRSSLGRPASSASGPSRHSSIRT